MGDDQYAEQARLGSLVQQVAEMALRIADRDAAIARLQREIEALRSRPDTEG